MDRLSPSFHYGAARDPNNVEAKKALRRAAQDLRNATNAVANGALKKKLIKKLEVSAQGATRTNRYQSSQQQLLTNCKMVADQLAKLLQV